MDLFRSKRSSAHEPLDDERPAKRISTPAGQRLSLIIESTHLRSKSPAAAKINVTTTSTYCNDPSHQHIGPVQHGHLTPKKTGIVSVLTGGRLNTPRESSEDKNPNGSNLSVSVWSERDAEKFGRIRHKKHGGAGAWWSRKRIAIVVAVLLAIIIALAVGLAVGLKKKSSTSSESPSQTTGHPQPADTGSRPGAQTETPSTPTTSIAPSSLPSGFPVGTHSLVTFLDTVQTDCTANAATWSCPPDTDYYSDPQKALTVMNWEISGSEGSYKISSKGPDATLGGAMFQNERLQLLDAGKDTERYFFQINKAKTVNMTGSLGEQKGDFECDYGFTTIQGSLYTRMAKTYPKETVAVPNTGNPVWPFATRVEQSAAGGESVPSCKKSGEQITDGLKGQDAGTLCSCLYKNWTPGKPTR